MFSKEKDKSKTTPYFIEIWTFHDKQSRPRNECLINLVQIEYFLSIIFFMIIHYDDFSFCDLKDDCQSFDLKPKILLRKSR